MEVTGSANARVGIIIGLGAAGLVLILVIYLAATGNLAVKESHVSCSQEVNGFVDCQGQYDELTEATEAEIGGGLIGPSGSQYYVSLSVEVGSGTVTVSFTDKYGQNTTQQVVPGQIARFEGYLDFFPYSGSGGNTRVATFWMTPEGGIATNVTYSAQLR